MFTEFISSLGDLGKLKISRMVRMESRPQGLEWGVTGDKVCETSQEACYSQVRKRSLHKVKLLAQSHSHKTAE